MADISRRRLLEGATAAGALAAAGSLLPPSVHAAMARPAPRGGLRAIKHVIVLMQENRSFDHYYGTLRGVRGFADAHPLLLSDGRTVFEQPDGRGGAVLPFSAREAARLAGRSAGDVEYLDALPHTWPDATQAAHEGRWDGWVPAKTPATMTYVDRRDAAFQYELADTFTLCDAYHCSMHGGTNPNRNYLWSGTTGVEPGTTRRALLNDAYDYDHAGYGWTCYPERLAKAGVDWRIYQEWDNYTDNAVEYFATFKKVGAKMLAAVTTRRYRTTEELYDSLPKLGEAERRATLGQLAEGRTRLTPAERDLFDRAMYRSEPGTLLSRIEADIAAGTLPAVTWIVPPAKDSEHPSVSGAIAGANLTYRLLDAIASNEKAWASTALFLNFDENDGYFDHVPAPMPPRPEGGEGDDWSDGHPIGLGPRVPMTIVSPWTVGGFVSSEVFDHTSVLRFLERWTGVEEPNISEWRRTVCGDLVGAFDFTRQGSPPLPSQPPAVPRATKRWHPNVPADQRMPRQEVGSRPARALPYAVSVGASIAPKALDLELVDVGARPAHFAVYAHHDAAAAPVHLDVAGQQRVRIPVTGGTYRVSVQGPNRYWADLAGSTSSAPVSVVVAPTPRGRSALVTVVNDDTQAHAVTLAGGEYGGHPRRVRVLAGGRRAVTWPTEDGWFDVRATLAGDAAFAWAFTGRLENGRPGRSA